MSEVISKVEKKQFPDFEKQLLSLEKEFLELRMSKSAGQVKDTSRFGKIRAEISRLKLKMSQAR